MGPQELGPGDEEMTVPNVYVEEAQRLPMDGISKVAVISALSTWRLRPPVGLPNQLIDPLSLHSQCTPGREAARLSRKQPKAAASVF